MYSGGTLSEQKETGTETLIALLFVIRVWKQPKRLSTGTQVNKLWCGYTKTYCLAIKWITKLDLSKQITPEHGL